MRWTARSAACLLTSERRWRFVGARMAALTPVCWHGEATAVGQALAAARKVRSMAEPHLAPWLVSWAGENGLRHGARQRDTSQLRKASMASVSRRVFRRVSQ